MSPVRREAMNAFLVVAGIMSAGMGLKGFLFSSHFIDGGVTGISIRPPWSPAAINARLP